VLQWNAFSLMLVGMALGFVVGLLPGKKYPDETIIYSGHWDHLGIGKPTVSAAVKRLSGADRKCSRRWARGWPGRGMPMQ